MRLFAGQFTIAAFLGLLQLVGEFVLANRVSASYFDSYVALRTQALLIAVAAVFGLDGVLLRRHADDREVANPLVLQGQLLATMLTGLTFAFFFVIDSDLMTAWPSVLGGLAISFCGLLSADMRVRGRFIAASLTRDAWRVFPIALALMLLLTTVDEGNLGPLFAAVALAGAVATSGAPLLSIFRTNPLHSLPSRKELILALGFISTSISLFIATFGDQLALSIAIDQSPPGILRGYSLVSGAFLYPSALAAASIGFILTPILVARARGRENGGPRTITLTAARLRSYLSPVRILVAALLVLTYSAAAIWGLRQVGVSAPAALWSAMLVAALIRLIHAVSSTLVAAYLPASALLKLAMLLLVSSLIQFGISSHFATSGSLTSLAWTSGAGWLFRAAITGLAVIHFVRTAATTDAMSTERQVADGEPIA